jgi:hypothetical protein
LQVLVSLNCILFRRLPMLTDKKKLFERDSPKKVCKLRPGDGRVVIMKNIY